MTQNLKGYANTCSNQILESLPTDFKDTMTTTDLEQEPVSVMIISFEDTMILIRFQVEQGTLDAKGR